jgi:hypothetical protein
MKQVLLNIEESKYKAFLSFIKTIDFISLVDEEGNNIPQWQIDEVNNRVEELKKHPEKAIDFNQMLDRIQVKHGL